MADMRRDTRMQAGDNLVVYSPLETLLGIFAVCCECTSHALGKTDQTGVSRVGGQEVELGKAEAVLLVYRFPHTPR